jgi:hypothetical protein
MMVVYLINILIIINTRLYYYYNEESNENNNETFFNSNLNPSDIKFESRHQAFIYVPPGGSSFSQIAAFKIW